MIAFRKTRMAASLAGVMAIFATPVFAQAGATDLFSYRAGATFVEIPSGAELSQMESTPLNLLDESTSTDWTGDGGRAVFVLELAEETELSRIAFDTAGLNRDQKAPRGFTVELSNTSADAGFEEVLSGSLRMAANNQSFPFKPEERPTGRWVRLTILGNHGDDYSGFTGFHGYGRATTNGATLPDMTGNYDGASGWGWVHMTQNGNRVSGCYEYQRGQFTGTINGRVLNLTMVDTDSNGARTTNQGLFQLTPDGRGIRGLVRGLDRASRDSYAAFYSARKVSRNPGGC
jgi:hypothetical protein